MSSSDESRPPQRDGAGRWLPGSRGGPGRKQLPDWLKGASDDLLRIQLDAALTGRLPALVIKEAELAELPIEAVMALKTAAVSATVVPAKERLLAAEKLLDRILGRAVQGVDLGDDAGAVLLQILRDKA